MLKLQELVGELGRSLRPPDIDSDLRRSQREVENSIGVEVVT
jgi:hypothetical protein